MTIKPLFDRVLVKPFAEDTLSAGGIHLPGQDGKKQTRGTVISVGQGAIADDGKLRALAVSEGDVVVFSKYSGTEIQVEGEDLLILKEEDLLGVVG